METDALDSALRVVLFQKRKGRMLHLVVFYSIKNSALEINYKIHEKELLSIVDSFQEWHHLLEGALH